MRGRSWVAAIGLGVAFGLQQGAVAQQTPTLKLAGRIVLLDVSVTDKAGKPVTDLRPEEFHVYEQKVEQKILSFEPPSQHAMPAATAGQVVVNSTADLSKVGDAPITVLVLDELNMSRDDAMYARDKLIAWLERQPAVLPQATALSAISYTNFTLVRDFTQDRAALLAALKQHSPGVLWRSENTGRLGPEASQHMFATLGALERISQVMRGVPGRKNVIWVGDGFPSVNYGDTGNTDGEKIADALRRLSTLMLHARVTLSVVGPALKGYQPTVIETQSDADMQSASANNGQILAYSGNLTFGGLAPPTGGHAYAGRNDLDAEIGRSYAEGVSYYTLSYTPSTANDNPKEYRGIHVEVTRPGLVVQTRDGYFGEAPAATTPSKLETQQLAFDLMGAATSTFTYTDLHMTVERAGGDNYVVHAAAKDMTWQDLPDGRRHADVIVMAAFLSQSGKMIGKTFTTLGSTTDASLASIGLVNASLNVKVTPPRGTVKIRFVVRDVFGGRVGTADLRP